MFKLGYSRTAQEHLITVLYLFALNFHYLFLFISDVYRLILLSVWKSCKNPSRSEKIYQTVWQTMIAGIREIPQKKCTAKRLGLPCIYANQQTYYRCIKSNMSWDLYQTEPVIICKSVQNCSILFMQVVYL